MHPDSTPLCLTARPRAAVLVLAAMSVLVIDSHAIGDTLVLRSAVRARSDDGSVLLRDVAELEGAELARFAEIVVAVVPSGSPAKELGVEEIRRRLEQAGANWAKVDLEGRRVVIRPRLSDLSGAPGVCAPASVEPPRTVRESAATGSRDTNAPGTSRTTTARDADRTPAQIEPRRFDPTRGPRRAGSEPVIAAAVMGERSVRALVADAVVRALGEDPEQVRLVFDGLDPATLAETPAGVRIEVEPIGMLDGDRAEFAVRWWRDGRVERRTNLSAFPSIARTASISSVDLRKGDRPDETQLSTATAWLRPSERSRVVRPGALGGRAMATGIRAGEPLIESHLERQLLIKRGDRIVVRSIVGSLAVRVDAVAQSDGREGEVIDCMRIGANAKSKSAFSATVTGRGEAVILQTPAAG